MTDDDQDGTAGLEDMLNMEAAKSDPQPAAAPPVPKTETKTRRGNEVFNKQDGVEVVSRHEAAKQEFGIEIPVDAVPLPSAGKVYPEDHPLHGAAHVEYTGMTAKEEDILMSQALIKRGTVITELIKSCLIDKRINVNSLISGDRNALMVAIRISGYGRFYEPTFVCPECKHKNEMKVDLASLDIKPLKLEPVEPGTNVFGFKLPKTGFDVEFKFLTGTEEEKIVQNNEARKKRGLQNNNLVTTRLLSSLVSVNGNISEANTAKFVQSMPAIDSLALRTHIDKHEPGVNMEVEFTCSNCEYYDNIQLPMGSSFFWPNS